MNYTNKQLKSIMAKLLPKDTYLGVNTGEVIWSTGVPVRDTELLHLCWLVEENLTEMESADYAELLRPIDANYKLLYHASWQQRVVALAKAKGVELKEEGE